ncbi:helix-turn-helix domain-containing protein [Streptomyces filamentosus]|uniref:helix-turn-helix domain-containing protein n=1 Tax=Streptomyces filamentosus TaxID=67294 RepID=UPI0038284CDF
MSQKGDSLAKSLEDPPQPTPAKTPAEFTAALRGLRVWSGLTYRQLEGKAAACADTLPASTIATTLGRVTLPRERFVDAFTRACGLSDEEVQKWLEVRRRVATTEPAAPGGDPDDKSDRPLTDAPGPVPAWWWRRAVGLLGAIGIGIAGTLGADSLFSNGPTHTSFPEVPVSGLRMLAVGSWAHIHPARTPALCLTEGRDRTGRYRTAIVAQRTCEKAVQPRVFLEPLAKNIVQIQWHHPKYGIGCLTVLEEGPGRNLLEPRDDCADDNQAQQFRLERYGPPDTARFRIRPVAAGQCLSLRDQDTGEGAEIVQGRCSGAADQDFLIKLIPPA